MKSLQMYANKIFGSRKFQCLLIAISVFCFTDGFSGDNLFHIMMVYMGANVAQKYIENKYK